VAAVPIADGAAVGALVRVIPGKFIVGVMQTLVAVSAIRGCFYLPQQTRYLVQHASPVFRTRAQHFTVPTDFPINEPGRPVAVIIGSNIPAAGAILFREDVAFDLLSLGQPFAIDFRAAILVDASWIIGTPGDARVVELPVGNLNILRGNLNIPF